MPINFYFQFFFFGGFCPLLKTGKFHIEHFNRQQIFDVKKSPQLNSQLARSSKSTSNFFSGYFKISVWDRKFLFSANPCPRICFYHSALDYWKIRFEQKYQKIFFLSQINLLFPFSTFYKLDFL